MEPENIEETQPPVEKPKKKAKELKQVEPAAESVDVETKQLKIVRKGVKGGAR